MNKKVLYTCITGSIDTLAPPHFVTPGWDYVCFTNNSNLLNSKLVWEIRLMDLKFPNDFRRSARYIKTQPHEILREYEYSIWTDGNTIIHGNLDRWIDTKVGNSDFIIYDHNKTLEDIRDCTYKEAMAVVRLKKEDRNVVNKQMKFYRSEGFPKGYGLITSMVIGRRHNDPDTIKLNNLWWNQICTYSKRDQLSFDYCRWKTGVEVSHAKGDTRDNLTFRLRPHRLGNSIG